MIFIELLNKTVDIVYILRLVSSVNTVDLKNNLYKYTLKEQFTNKKFDLNGKYYLCSIQNFLKFYILFENKRNKILRVVT